MLLMQAFKVVESDATLLSPVSALQAVHADVGCSSQVDETVWDEGW